MKRSTYLETVFDAQLRLEHEKDKEEHISSGKLSASWLWQPARFQLLKTLGVPEKPFEDYALGLFARGKEAEKAVIDRLRAKDGLIVEEQKQVSYNNVVGYVDAVIDTSKLADFKVGIIPLEIKSMKSSAFKYLEKNGEINYRYKLQGGLYALAMGVDHYALWLSAADDHRRRVFILDVADIVQDIREIIGIYDDCLKNHKVPAWSVREKWMSNPQYMRFDSKWAEFTEEEFRQELKNIGIDY